MVGEIADIKLTPPAGQPARTDDLWQTTCCEAFLQADDGSYIEFNFAPSGNWAIYRFSSYRSGMVPALDIPSPNITVEQGLHRLVLTASLTLPSMELDRIDAAGLTMVVEQVDGTKSYWALAHAPGQPDFHHAACFTLPVPAPGIS